METNKVKCYGKLMSCYVNRQNDTIVRVSVRNGRRLEFINFCYRGALPDGIIEDDFVEITGHTVAYQKRKDGKYEKRIQYFVADEIRKAASPMEDAKNDVSRETNGFRGYLDGTLVNIGKKNGYANLFIRVTADGGKPNFVKISMKENKLPKEIEKGDAVEALFYVSVASRDTEDGKKEYFEDLYASEILKK